MTDHPIYKDEEVKADLISGILNYLVWQDIDPDRLVGLRAEAETYLDGMTGDQMRAVVSLVIRNANRTGRSTDLLELVTQVKEAQSPVRCKNCAGALEPIGMGGSLVCDSCGGVVLFPQEE